MKSFVRRQYTPLRALAVLTFVLYLIYADRGIVAGSATSIKGCVESVDACPKERKSIHCSNTNNNTSRNASTFDCKTCRVCNTVCDGVLIEQTGFGISNAKLAVLQSGFMGGYLVGCLLSAQLSQKMLPFRVIGYGLTIWCCSVLISGFAGFIQSTMNSSVDSHSATPMWPYFLMVFGRVLSGFGEASINTLSLPFLNSILEPSTKGFYIGIYYTAIPAGTALGFIYAGIITAITGGHWEWTFLLEAPVMLPCAMLAFFVPFQASMNENGEYVYTLLEDEDNSVNHRQPLLDTSIGRAKLPITFYENIISCLSRPIFVLSCLGYTVYTGVVGGLQFYGPLFVQSYRPCDKRWNFTQEGTDIIFGSMICIAGFTGTILGGYVIDRFKMDISLKSLAFLCATEMSLGCILALVLVLMTTPNLFFVAFFILQMALFMISPAVNLLTLKSVPVENGPMAMGLLTLSIHIFGDVPSPLLIGAFSDVHSPLATLETALSFLTLAAFFWGLIILLRGFNDESSADFGDNRNTMN